VVFSRYVALGDSFTEGVGDPHPASPNGLRGWADHVAVALTQYNPELRYANLAVRGRRMDEILADQLQTAVMLEPAALLASSPPVRTFWTNLRWTIAFAAPWVAKRLRRATPGAGVEPKYPALTQIISLRARPTPQVGEGKSPATHRISGTCASLSEDGPPETTVYDE
jgi:hypothetical protein